ncbi:TPA: hypothetical protein EYO12_01650 [Candidatus Saccharibacteria bacterium]|nr:hypothetical protein [Candidatus Saccharibacteria bacterium]HIO87422.1 hypothetical protein [Candidatus Saccharibacteria bacterium]
MNVFDPSVWDDPKTATLLSAIAAAENLAQAKIILADLLTTKEISELSNRIYIAKLLLNKVNYLDIQKETGCSAATVAEVSKKLKTGSGGYKLILSKLNQDDLNF